MRKGSRFEQLFLPHLDAAYSLARWIVGKEQGALSLATRAHSSSRQGNRRGTVRNHGRRLEALLRNQCAQGKTSAAAFSNPATARISESARLRKSLPMSGEAPDRDIRGFCVRNNSTSCSRSDCLISAAGLAERGASISRIMAGCCAMALIVTFRNLSISPI